MLVKQNNACIDWASEVQSAKEEVEVGSTYVGCDNSIGIGIQRREVTQGSSRPQLFLTLHYDMLPLARRYQLRLFQGRFKYTCARCGTPYFLLLILYESAL